MIDINDNDFKLLKMNESLLSRLSVKDGKDYVQALTNYQKLAKKIDSNSYQELIDKIKNYEDNQHKLPLEEELTFLQELENQYDSLNELQCKFRNVDDDLELSDISTIDRDAISRRKDLISGYLINLKNIEDCNKKIEASNDRLISENKKKELMTSKYQALERDLKRNFINAEGRKISTNGDIEYTSVKEEYRSNGLDLDTLLEDNSKLREKLEELNSARKEKEEVLATAQICYDSLPSKENKEILDSLKIDAIKAKYLLSLVKIVDKISKEVTNYDALVSKREDINDLIRSRVNYLQYLGIRFSFDPFLGIKLGEQMDYLDNFKDNSKMITRIMREIADLDDNLREIEDKNIEFTRSLTEDIKIIIDKKSLSEIDITNVSLDTEEDDRSDDTSLEEESMVPEDNQVIRIDKLPAEFKIQRVKDKTLGVIKRVNQIFNDIDTAAKGKDTTKLEEEKEEENPELVIEPAVIQKEDISEGTIKEDKIDTSDDIEDDDEVEIVFPREPEIGEEALVIPEVPKTETIPEVTLTEKENIFEDNLDSPFTNISLFDDRKDDSEIFDTEDNNEKENTLKEKNMDEEMTMPLTFWETMPQEEKPSEEKETPSFDEQIKKLKLTM